MKCLSNIPLLPILALLLIFICMLIFCLPINKTEPIFEPATDTLLCEQGYPQALLSLLHPPIKKALLEKAEQNFTFKKGSITFFTDNGEETISLMPYSDSTMDTNSSDLVLCLLSAVNEKGETYLLCIYKMAPSVSSNENVLSLTWDDPQTTMKDNTFCKADYAAMNGNILSDYTEQELSFEYGYGRYLGDGYLWYLDHSTLSKLQRLDCFYGYGELVLLPKEPSELHVYATLYPSPSLLKGRDTELSLP